MRAIALCLLLLGAVVYLLPTFKDVLPLHLAIANNDAQVLGGFLVGAGVIIRILTRRG